MAWWAGFRVPPPVFQSFLVRAVGSGAVVAIVMTLMVGLLDGWLNHPTVPEVIVLVAVGAVTSGVLMSLWYHLKAARLDLPDWDDYGDA